MKLQKKQSFVIGFFIANMAINAAAIDNPTQERAPLFMAVGEQRMLPLGDFKRYSLSGDALRFTRLSSGLLLKATKAGQSTLIIHRSAMVTETRTIRVEPRKTALFSPSLYQSLNGLNETEVIEEGEHFILRGIIRHPNEATKIAYLRDHFQKQIINETTLEEKWLIDSQKKMDEFLKKYPSLKYSMIEGDSWVHGSLRHRGDVSAVEQKLKSIQPMVQTDIQSLKDHDPTIYFKVFLLELKKDQRTDIGMTWPETHAGSLKISPLQLMMNNPIELTLNALSLKGVVNILSSPELVVRAPGKAEIFAGGELPIRQRTKNTDVVIWKNFGLLLKLDVQTLAGDQVRLDIETEISHLDQELSNDDIPMVQSNHIKTQVDSTLGKPLLLSGLLQEGFQQKTKGLPFLSSIPILGKLFSSESFQKNKSELVAILLPYASLPPHPMQRISSAAPRGYLPIPRSEFSTHELDEKKEEKSYPWNVL